MKTEAKALVPIGSEIILNLGDTLGAQVGQVFTLETEGRKAFLIVRAIEPNTKVLRCERVEALSAMKLVYCNCLQNIEFQHGRGFLYGGMRAHGEIVACPICGQKYRCRLCGNASECTSGGCITWHKCTPGRKAATKAAKKPHRKP